MKHVHHAPRVQLRSLHCRASCSRSAFTSTTNPGRLTWNVNGPFGRLCRRPLNLAGDSELSHHVARSIDVCDCRTDLNVCSVVL